MSFTSAEPPTEFIDTNILVYAHDSDAGPKLPIVQKLISRLNDSEAGALSLQVLAEFYSVSTRKFRLPVETAESIVRDFGLWKIHIPIHEDLLRASRLLRRHNLSWWDAMLVNSAMQIGAITLWSEDLQAGQRFGSLTIRNPFVE